MVSNGYHPPPTHPPYSVCDFGLMDRLVLRLTGWLFTYGWTRASWAVCDGWRWAAQLRRDVRWLLTR